MSRKASPSLTSVSSMSIDTRIASMITGKAVLDIGSHKRPMPSVIARQLRPAALSAISPTGIEFYIPHKSDRSHALEKVRRHTLKQVTKTKGRKSNAFRTAFDVVAVFEYDVGESWKEEFAAGLRDTCGKKGEAIITSTNEGHWVMRERCAMDVRVGQDVDEEADPYLIDTLSRYFNSVEVQLPDRELGEAECLIVCREPVEKRSSWWSQE